MARATTPTLTETDTETNTSRAPVFGVDETGALHRWDARLEAVVVTDPDGEIELVERDVDQDTVSGNGKTWQQYVADSRGWVRFWFDDSVPPFGAVTAALDEVQQ